jgi:hypothetical protein
MTTKKEFYKLLSEDQAGNGFLSRFIILEDDDRQKEMQFSPNRIPPLELVKAARSCMTECARISKMVDNRINVTFDADIVQRVQEAIEDYFGLSADVLATYRCTEEMRMQMIVSKRYFSQRLSRNAAFYKDQRKARFAIDLAIRDAISGGLIEPIKYGRSAEYYKILME